MRWVLWFTEYTTLLITSLCAVSYCEPAFSHSDSPPPSGRPTPSGSPTTGGSFLPTPSDPPTPGGSPTPRCSDSPPPSDPPTPSGSSTPSCRDSPHPRNPPASSDSHPPGCSDSPPPSGPLPFVIASECDIGKLLLSNVNISTLSREDKYKILIAESNPEPRSYPYTGPYASAPIPPVQSSLAEQYPWLHYR